jgi:hypothetical protein
MQFYRPDPADLKPATRVFYRHALAILAETKLPFLVCGSYALESYTGIARHTKDLDVFIRPPDCERALEAFAAAGYATELTFSHWLGKVFCGDDFLDVIFNSGNGLCRVDDTWFAHAVEGEVFGLAVKFCPPEEIIWQKAFLMERERFDGADVAHLIRACGKRLDWTRLLGRFGPYWRVLLAHLILFGFVYPADRSIVPEAILHELLGRLQNEKSAPVPRAPLCQGTLVSREQYLADLERFGYQDARLPPHGKMTKEEIQRWTAAIYEGTADACPS